MALKNRGLAAGNLIAGLVSVVCIILVYSWFYPHMVESQTLAEGMGAPERLTDHNFVTWDTMTVALLIVCALIIVAAARDEDYPSKYYGGR